jgi:ribonuclease HII
MTKVIIGVDEVGCGALAGPLVVAAAAFSGMDERVTATFRGLRSEKTLTVCDSKSIKNEDHRAVLARAVEKQALATCIIERTNKEIDARLLSVVFPETIGLVIARVLEELQHKGIATSPEDFLIMIDGDIRLPPNIPCPFRTVIDGDKKIWQIGAASIIAKVKRDERMVQLHEKYPDYGFDKNKGYPVPAHKKLLATHGPSAVHRRSFRPVAESQGLPEGFEA